MARNVEPIFAEEPKLGAGVINVIVTIAGHKLDANRMDSGDPALPEVMQQRLALTTPDQTVSRTAPLAEPPLTIKGAVNIAFDTVFGEDRDGLSAPTQSESSSALTIVKSLDHIVKPKDLLHPQVTGLDSTSNGVVITDRQGIIQSVNLGFTSMTGFSSAEAVGRNSCEILNSGIHDLEVFGRMWKAILAGETWSGEMVNRRKDGSLYHEDQTITPVMNDRDEITNFVSIKMDVTARRLELDSAIQIQRGLLPSRPPDMRDFELAASCSPASGVGGDFFDWQQLDANTVDFSVVDVMCKGMGAALLMATVRSALRASAHLPSPAQVLRQVEQAIGDDLRGAESFVTLFYGRLNINEHRVSYVDAGHGLGFIQRASGLTEALENRGLPLGIFLDMNVQESVVFLDSGDSLILHTDGLVEDAIGNMSDPKKILRGAKDLTNAPAIVDELTQSSKRRNCGNDDATVLVLTCTSNR